MKDIKVLTLSAAIALFTLISAVHAMAFNGQGVADGTGPIVNIFSDGVPVTISGVIAESSYDGTGVQIDTGTEVITVYGLGSYRYWDSLGVERPSVGDTVTVNGYEVTFSDGTVKIIAADVTVDGQTIELRDPETGTPLWRGGFGQGAMNSGGAGYTGMGGRWSR